MTTVAIVVSGGSGSRFGRAEGKQSVVLDGHPLFAWAVAACAASGVVDAIVLVAPSERHDEFESAAASAAAGLGLTLVESGMTRQQSVANGLAHATDADVVVVHDGARPLASAALVRDAITALLADDEADGAIVGHPSVDTLKFVSDGVVEGTPERDALWAIQTPQVFRADVLRAAYESADTDGFLGTDDASLVERAGGRVLVIEGPRDNLKVTRPEDLTLVEAAWAARKDETR